MILLIILIGLTIWLTITIFGVILCNNNDAIGILLLFLSLLIIGVMLGVYLLYNSRSKEKIIKKHDNNLKNNREFIN